MAARATTGTTLLLRVDCEHTEALRWGGSTDLEVSGIRRVLALLDELGIRATFAFVGLTAQAFPELAQAARAGGHAIAGHSMRHAGPYAGRPAAWQYDDMTAMIAAIDRACGARVRGLAAPCHGLIDAATMRMAARAGLAYLLNFTITAPAGRGFAPAPDMPATVLAPPASMRVIWDWTDRQPGSPPFTAAQARRAWAAALTAATEEAALISLIIHPWIVELNQEAALLAEFLGHARRRGPPFATFDEIVFPVAATHAAGHEPGA